MQLKNMKMTFKNWMEWHSFMRQTGAVCTIDDKSFLTEGGCPECGHKEWLITSDGWAYCQNCGYGQSQDFDVREQPYVYELTKEGEKIKR